ncbi:guanine nucleotide binding protein, alpha subunit [Chytriomyces sp. MP71]|nr:guanine nucleotide binding protein, alpha subunit [Chytriomyces sp. MP71]
MLPLQSCVCSFIENCRLDMLLFCCPRRDQRVEMGACSSKTEEELEQESLSKMIDRQLERERRAFQPEVKLLLLGASETGKSTILKQFRILYGNGFTAFEKGMYASAIRSNLLVSAKTLCAAMDDLRIPFGFDVKAWREMTPTASKRGSIDRTATLSCPSLTHSPQCGISRAGSGRDLCGAGSDLSKATLDHYSLTVSFCQIARTGSSKSSLSHPPPPPSKDPAAPYAERCYEEKGGEDGQIGESVFAARVIKEACYASPLSREQIDAIKILWKDPGVQYCYSRANEFQLYDTAGYFFTEIERLCSETYQPTDQDILNIRICTTGVCETQFAMEDAMFRVVDVGGQRGERKKWALQFSDVKAIIFLIDISAYDRFCYEDNTTNRLDESLNLFSSICNHPLFKHVCLILFLNKMDLFKEKIKKSPLSRWVPDYTGPSEAVEAGSHLLTKFLNVNKYKEKDIYPHFTCAVSTSQIRIILETVRVVVFKSFLSNFGFM